MALSHAGTFAIANSPNCTQCSAGTFQTLDGAVSCKSCDIGFAVPYQGASVCVSCQPGFYQSAEGQISCLACAPGKIAPLPKSSFCISCQAGEFNPRFGCLSIDCDCCRFVC